VHFNDPIAVSPRTDQFLYSLPGSPDVAAALKLLALQARVSPAAYGF
jgi:hypothetical protein